MKTAVLFANHEHLWTLVITELLRNVLEFHFTYQHNLKLK
jgi:hypothetical protein